MTCRDYQQEPTHGFCSTQITEARALSLMAQFGPVKPSHEHKPLRDARNHPRGRGTDEPQP